METIFKHLRDIFFKVRKEGKIDTYDSKYRYGDIVVYDENNHAIEIHQIGRTNKDGTPVSRERKVIEEIGKTRGIKVIFHALIALLIMALTFFFMHCL